MYGLPEDVSGDFFLGRRPDSVLFTVNTVALAFDNEMQSLPALSVTTATRFRHHIPELNGVYEEIQQHPVRSSRLMQVIDVAVKSVKIERPGTLTLEFDDGQLLTFFDDTPEQYESYYIGFADKTIIV